MDEHELLLRHAERWAADHGRALDRSLVGLVLELRVTHDGWAANLWPAGSVRDLMLERWPSHGPAEPPDVDLLVESLDTFWRFLRSTGRMGAASAEPAELRKEARKAARQMPAACADTSRYGVAKSLVGFGSEIGVSLDDAADVDEINARMARIVEAWNALPIEERRRRSGGADVAGRPGFVAGPEPVGEEEERFIPNDPSVSAPYVRSSAYVAKVLELASWVGQGREVTATGVLRPAVAREAYTALDLWSWERRWDPFLAGASADPAADAAGAEAALRRWRSAGDCLALDRLWFPALMAELVAIRGKKAFSEVSVLPSSDEEWVHLGLGLLLFLAYRTLAPAAGGVEVLVSVLVLLQPEVGGGPRTEQELQEQWWASPANQTAELLAGMAVARELSDAEVSACLGMFDDAGLWTRQGSRLVATPLAWDFALMVIAADDSGFFDLPA